MAAHMWLVCRIVRRYRLFPLPVALDRSDLLMAGSAGLVRAAWLWDGRRRFATYAFHFVRGSIFQEIRRMTGMPAWLFRAVMHIKRIAVYLEARGAQATPENIAMVLGSVEMGEAEHHRIVPATGDLVRGLLHWKPKRVHLEDLAGRGEGWPDEDTGDSNRRVGAVTREECQAAQGEMPCSHQSICNDVFNNGMTLREAAKAGGVTYREACRVHGEAVAYLRWRLSPLTGRERSVVPPAMRCRDIGCRGCLRASRECPGARHNRQRARLILKHRNDGEGGAFVCCGAAVEPGAPRMKDRTDCEVWVMRHTMRLRNVEAALALGMNPVTVASRYKRMRDSLSK